ncbi:hypothetical protein BD289DRAFT_157069 [Coniella lustricola]|uniref:Uncharacterized protein n=1 Tax=Coniella lustricola TaxID=2025994 RepID=A0A2T3AMQ1_9PEZI|nr:hypothetical protein BD289DRAFT_157069 [Coniella lustricola]
MMSCCCVWPNVQGANFFTTFNFEHSIWFHIYSICLFYCFGYWHRRGLEDLLFPLLFIVLILYMERATQNSEDALLWRRFRSRNTELVEFTNLIIYTYTCMP